MKPAILSLVLGLLAVTAQGQQTATYTDAEAGKHVGEEATVTGKVVTVSTTASGTTFMNFGDRFPKHTFTGVIFASKSESVGDVKQYEGKDVSLTGKIELSRDQKPQIVISKADQLKLAGAPSAPPPAPASATPAPAPAMTAPMPAVPSGIPASELTSKTTGKISLAMSWSSPVNGGEMTRKDLAKIFGVSGSASETTDVSTAFEVYPGVPFLTNLIEAKRRLNLTNAPASKNRIVTPGLPQSSLTSHLFNGVFVGGFDRLYLVTDNTDQVISALVVESNTRTRVLNEPDITGYHTYNFLTGRAKATNDLVIRHQITPAPSAAGVVLVDTLLIDPTDPENPPPRTSRSSSSKSSSYNKPKTGKVLERSRWFVPVPVVNLILRCVVQ